MNQEMIRYVVSGVLQEMAGQQEAGLIPVEVSARHAHLSGRDIEALFGPGHTLTPKRELSQPGQFLAEERVSIVTYKGELRNVAVLGPAREHTQIELSLTDARALGLDAPLRQSGDTAGCPSVGLLSGSRMLETAESVMVAQNHIHMTPADAARFGVRDGQRVQVAMQTARPVTFQDVLIRVDGQFALSMHIDFDEANACMFQAGDQGRLAQ